MITTEQFNTTFADAPPLPPGVEEDVYFWALQENAATGGMTCAFGLSFEGQRLWVK